VLLTRPTTDQEHSPLSGNHSVPVSNNTGALEKHLSCENRKHAVLRARSLGNARSKQCE
jgi:hypothetical protein